MCCAAPAGECRALAGWLRPCLPARFARRAPPRKLQCRRSDLPPSCGAFVHVVEECWRCGRAVGVLQLSGSHTPCRHCCVCMSSQSPQHSLLPACESQLPTGLNEGAIVRVCICITCIPSRAALRVWWLPAFHSTWFCTTGLNRLSKPVRGRLSYQRLKRWLENHAQFACGPFALYLTLVGASCSEHDLLRVAAACAQRFEWYPLMQCRSAWNPLANRTV